MLFSYFIQPFIDYHFMTNALLGACILALSTGPLGVFLILRRMSLMADSMSHAILPGVAVGFLLAGSSLLAMLLGGLVAGLVVALASGWVSRHTRLKEETSFGVFYIIALGLGVILISMRGSNMDLLHILFGTVLGLDQTSLILVSGSSLICLVVLTLIYRPLVMECFDQYFMQHSTGKGWLVHTVFLLLLVGILVSGFQIMGTLMMVGMLLLPAAAASFIGRTVKKQLFWSSLFGCLSVYFGLLISFHASVPASSSIILVAGVIYLFAMLWGAQGLVRQKFTR